MTNKPKVKRYDDMGCPEQICRVDTIQESDDGDFVLYEDYEALAAECSALVEALEQCITSMLDSGYRANALVIRAARAALAAHRKGGEA